MLSSITIRDALPQDAAALLAIVRALAVYERAPNAVQMTETDLADALAASPRLLHAHIAEHDGMVLGAALWFVSFSTWTGRAGLSLEDVFVVPEARGQGVGRALFRALARTAHERGFARIDWRVLDWNSDAIGFYTALGATPQNEWTGYRLAGPALEALANQETNHG